MLSIRVSSPKEENIWFLQHKNRSLLARALDGHDYHTPCALSVSNARPSCVVCPFLNVAGIGWQPTGKLEIVSFRAVSKQWFLELGIPNISGTQKPD
jgi:hypothetical protein